MRSIARDLGADHMRCGSVQRAGDRVRVAYSLIHAESAVQVAGDAVDGSMNDLATVEDRLLESLVRSLNLRAEPVSSGR